MDTVVAASAAVLTTVEAAVAVRDGRPEVRADAADRFAVLVARGLLVELGHGLNHLIIELFHDLIGTIESSIVHRLVPRVSASALLDLLDQ